MNYCGTRHPIKFKLQPQGSELKLSDVERRIFGSRFTGAADEAWPPSHNQCNRESGGSHRPKLARAELSKRGWLMQTKYVADDVGQDRPGAVLADRL